MLKIESVVDKENFKDEKYDRNIIYFKRMK